VTAEFKIFISPADCAVWTHPHFYTDPLPRLRLLVVVQITLDDFLRAANAYGELDASEEAAASDLHQAFQVFDESRRGRVSGARLRAALTTLGERLSDEDVDAMMGLLGLDELADINRDIDYTSLVEKLASV